MCMNPRIEKSLKWRFKMRKLGASHMMLSSGDCDENVRK